MLKKLWMLMLLVFLSGCNTPRPAATPASAPAAPVKTAASAPVKTATATRPPTIIPTATNTPTATTAPTDTPTAEPTADAAVVEAAYLAAERALYYDHTLDEVLTTFTAEDFARYLGGLEADAWLAAQQAYQESGNYPLAYTTYEAEHSITVRDCSRFTCYLDIAHRTLSVRVRQADGTWQVVTVAEDPQYAAVGTQTLRMGYSADYGWRIAEYISWTPAE